MDEHDVPEQEPQIEPEDVQTPGPTDESLPVPTDFRRNAWLLAIIVGVVVVAWVMVMLKGCSPEDADLRPALSTPAAALPPAARPAAPERQGPPPEPTTPPVSFVVGSDRELIVASPPLRMQQDGPTYRAARMFDITDKAPGLNMQHVLRVMAPMTRYADQASVYEPAEDTEPAFKPVAEVKSLRPQDRVLVIPGLAETQAFPHAAAERFVGVYANSDGRTVMLTWNPLRQLARCLVAQSEDGDIEWRDAGLTHQGDPVLYDTATGSLWDASSGLALTGPLAGASAGTICVGVTTWQEWSGAHPDGEVFVAGLQATGVAVTGEVPSDRALDAWLGSSYLPPGSEPGSGGPPADKEFVLGVVVGDEAKAYPLGALAADGREPFTDTVGGREVRVTVRSPMAATAEIAGETLDTAEVMLWFAWRDLHPGSSVYAAEPDEAVSTE